MSEALFKSSRGDVGPNHILDALRKVKADECDVLYIHTDMTFGLPTMPRGALLNELFGILRALDVKTLVFPTFTFSFCNDEAYDVQKSKTPMGALNEYVRKSGAGVRTLDPLLSVYVVGDPLNLVDDLSPYSIGCDSNYDRLHRCGKDVKFLFFGADMRACYTYTHYAEAVIGVPYRYNRRFAGDIINNGIADKDKEVWLYSTYANCRLNPIPVVYNEMARRGQLAQAPVGDNGVCCFSEKDGWETLEYLLTENPLCLTDGTFDESEKDATYHKNGRIVSVK